MNKKVKLERLDKLSSEIQELFKDIQKDMFGEVVDVINNSIDIYNEIDNKLPDKFKPILSKLFRKINKRNLNNLASIVVPHDMVTLNVNEIIILHAMFDIKLGFISDTDGASYFMKSEDLIPQINTDALVANPGLIKRKFSVDIVKTSSTGVKTTKALEPESWKDVTFSVRLFDKRLNKNYKLIDKSITETIQSFSKGEFLSKSKKIEKSVIELSELSYSIDNSDLSDQLLASAKIDTNENFFKTPTLNGYFDEQEDTKQILDMQEEGLLPSIFNPNSLEDLEKQYFYILLDTSDSTHKMGAYKVLDLVCNQASKFLNEKMSGKIELRILPYSSYVQKTISELNGFILPGGSTYTNLAIDVAIKLLDAKYNNKVIDEDIIISDARNKNNASSLFDYENESTDVIVDNNMVKVNNCHILLLSDGVPNSQNSTVKAAKEAYDFNINFTQLVVAYDLGDLTEMIQKQTLRSLGADEDIVNMSEYIDAFNEVSRAGGGESFIIWINEKIAEALVSMFDLSLGRNYLKLLELEDV